MNYNLLREKWLPVIRADGSHDRIAPYEIVGGDSPPVDIIPPRPDFRAALMEFLIGLIQTVYPPDQEKDWQGGFINPPSQDELQSAMLVHEAYFNLFGQRPRFMQDLTMSEKEKPKEWPASFLLIDGPGENTFTENKDFFVKRGLIESLCPACAATALLTLQQFSPSGGQGHMTSIRGGGPLSTLISGGEVASSGEVVGGTLWEKIWLNVIPLSYDRKKTPPISGDISENVFPWVIKTRCSNEYGKTSPSDVHPLHVYWGMPRRVILIDNSNFCVCSICGIASDVSVASFLIRPRGYDYDDTWIHPLSPYRLKSSLPNGTIKGQANILAYRNWAGFIYGTTDSTVVPALCVRHASSELFNAEVSIAGYDMDKDKAIQWCEQKIPVYHAHDEEFFDIIREIVLAADKIKGNLLVAIKKALFSGKDNQANSRKTFLANIEAAFWHDSSSFFNDLIYALAKIDIETKQSLLLDKWARHIRTVAENLFNENVMTASIPPKHYKTYMDAWFKMQKDNNTYLSKTKGLLVRGDVK
ncbi:type I-E CRISPR-associated protein Cse1/CasA [Maridesulfovibrio sp.]|uniref:type I-E CRISPR-associated protein Cse1/CasA n=1 Tax=Maridesulfovibrio sp. TaxID=2795000 RepID=UPI0029CA51FD|nr:type I-E CRISPR-associated protein Cse1/CasA [Maridesulfovibrio sp.]